MNGLLLAPEHSAQRFDLRGSLFVLALLLPVAAMANSGAGLVEMGFTWLVFVPFTLGAIEALALRWVFRVRRRDAFRYMVYANYVSTGAGMVMVELTPFLRDRPVVLWVLAYALTLFTEALFVAKLSDTRYCSVTTWVRTAVVNVFTYALLVAIACGGDAGGNLVMVLTLLSLVLGALWLMAWAESKVLRRLVGTGTPRSTALLCCANACGTVAVLLVVWVLTRAWPTDPPQTNLLPYANDRAGNPIFWVALFGAALACKNAFVAALTKRRYCSPVTLGRTLAVSLCGYAVLVAVGTVFLLAP